MKAKKAVMFVLAIVLSISLFAQGAGEREFVLDTYEKNTEYLSTYFAVDLEGNDMLTSFSDALSAITGHDESVPRGAEDVIKLAVDAAGFKELALTYSDEKAESRLKSYGIISSSNPAYAAAALDSGLLDASLVNGLLSSESLSKENAASVLMAVVNATGKGRNYIGYAFDSDIQAKIENTFKTVGLYTNEELDTVGALLVQEKSSTGYNLKKESDDARFLDSLTIRYGHSDKNHVKQLVALLVSEDINALIQVEPKTSIYEYLLEWGPVPEPEDDYYVEKFSEDLYLVHATEFDLEIEFESLEDLERFDSVINQYSKKNDENQAPGSNVNLILGAWWQPLYSATFCPDESAYTPIIDNILYSEDGEYSIHPYTTVEDSPSLIAREKALSDGGLTETDYRYVNNAFYRYLTGVDHQ